jgi:hypothetical protein
MQLKFRVFFFMALRWLIDQLDFIDFNGSPSSIIILTSSLYIFK